MFDKIRRLGTDTALYGVSTILGRFLTFVLTPIYTHVLITDDLGVVATVYAYIAFFNVVYGYGMEGAFMKYVSTLEAGDRKQNFSVPFLSVGATSLLFSVLILLLRTPLAEAAGVPPSLSVVVPCAGLILFFDALTIIPFASLRMQRKAKTFVAIRLAGIVVNVLLNLLLVVVWKGGVEGIFLSGVLSSALSFALLVPHILSEFTLELPAGLLPALLRFGLPSVPAGLASMMIQVINRPIMGAMMGTAAVGVFQANYRLGIFMMLLVSMFDFAWRPFFLSHASDHDARPLFARVLTYYTLIATSIFLFLTFFIGDLVTLPIFAGHSLFARPYWGGLGIVPWVLLGYLFLGVYNNLLAGIYIEKKTRYLPAVTFTGAAVNILATILLIPPWGMMGAAFATFLAYFLMALALYLVVRRFYPVPYEWKRLLKIALAAGVAMAFYILVDPGTYALLWKIALLCFFLMLLTLVKFFVPSEIAGLTRLLSRASGTDAPPPDDGV